MDTIKSSQISRVVYGLMDPDEDIYEGLITTIESEGMRAGLVLTVTGAVSRTRLVAPRAQEEVDEAPGVVEFDGQAEISAHGYFGYSDADYESAAGGIRYEAGRPMLHVHATVSSGERTVCGHLIEGCRVRSVYTKSHFVVVLAEVEGIDLRFLVSGETTEHYPNGIPYYSLG